LFINKKNDVCFFGEAFSLLLLGKILMFADIKTVIVKNRKLLYNIKTGGFAINFKPMTKNYRNFLWLLTILVVASFGVWQWSKKTVSAEDLRFDEQTLTVQAIAKAMPSVVSINVYNDQEIILDTNGQVQKKIVKTYQGAGTGFLISADGLILTNKHVVGVATKTAQYQVVLSSGSKQNAQLIGIDPLNDLAVLRILGNQLPFLEIGSSKMMPLGTTVIAVGNVLGKYPNSVSKGIISGKGRALAAVTDGSSLVEDLDNILQTDANISSGHSGGPLINLKGQVVGVNVATDKAGSAVGFAIPIDDAKPIINSVIKHGRVIRTRLGVRYIALTPQNAIKLEAIRDRGALIIKSEPGLMAIAPNSPAAKAGLTEGDIITEVNGIDVGDENSLSSLVQEYQPGDKLKLRVVRGFQTLFIEVILDEFIAN